MIEITCVKFIQENNLLFLSQDFLSPTFAVFDHITRTHSLFKNHPRGNDQKSSSPTCMAMYSNLRINIFSDNYTFFPFCKLKSIRLIILNIFVKSVAVMSFQPKL